jgi:hypothetical protein
VRWPWSSADLHGDALGAAALSDDRWRKFHDAFKYQIFLGAKFLRVAIQKEVHGLLTHFYDFVGKGEFNRLSEREKRTQTTAPDFV